MRVLCNRIISKITQQDLGETSPWLIKNKEYIVLALNICEKTGIDIYIQTENYNQPMFINIVGFEFIDQRVPSSWITVVRESHERKIITMLPASWNYEGFFDDVMEEQPKAVSLFNKEASIIYEEDSSQK